MQRGYCGCTRAWKGTQNIVANDEHKSQMNIDRIKNESYAAVCSKYNLSLAHTQQHYNVATRHTRWLHFC